MILIDEYGDRTTILSGDVVDLGPDGFIRWYPEPEATAQRIMLESHQQRVRDSIDFVRRKVAGDLAIVRKGVELAERREKSPSYVMELREILKSLDDILTQAK